MNCNTTHYRANSSSVPGDPTIVPTDHGPSPRLFVRHGLEAELTRAVYYELAELAIAEGADPAGIWSGGIFFPLDNGE